MSIHFQLNPEYHAFERELLNIQVHFSDSDQSIHKARNELRIATIHDQQTVIKAFKVPHFINRIVYAYFRSSKAKKSFENAMELVSRGVNTPAPIGYLENFRFSLLSTSYFLSLYEPYDFTIREALHHNVDDYKEILKQFAKFTFDVHQKGVWHIDYSPGNILVKKEHDTYKFSLVDINRMEFKKINGHEGIKNFNKLWAQEDDMNLMIQEYAACSGLDPDQAIAIALAESRRHQDKVAMKKRLKGKKQ